MRFKFSPHHISIASSLVFISLISLCFSGSALAETNTTKPSTTIKSIIDSQQSNTESQFKSLYEKAAAFQKKEFPSGAGNGDEADDSNDYESSDAAEKKRLAFWQGIAKDVTRIDSANLSADSRINLRIFSDQVTNRISRVFLMLI